MYLPITSPLALASALFYPSSHDSSRLEPAKSETTLAPSLAVRQEAIAPPSSDSLISTSVVTLTPSLLLTSTAASSFATASSPTPTSTSIFTAMDPAVPASTFSTASSTTQAINPTQSANVESSSAAWATKGVIAGIVIGSVLGLILLGVLIHFLHATYRGINVCNCFGACCRHDDDEEKTRASTPGARSGTTAGYNRPMSSAPLPLMLPQQIAEDRRASKLQRKKG